MAFCCMSEWWGFKVSCYPELGGLEGFGQSVAEEESCWVTLARSAVLDPCLQGFSSWAGRSRKRVSSAKSSFVSLWL